MQCYPLASVIYLRTTACYDRDANESKDDLKTIKSLMRYEAEGSKTLMISYHDAEWKQTNRSKQYEKQTFTYFRTGFMYALYVKHNSRSRLVKETLGQRGFSNNQRKKQSLSVRKHSMMGSVVDGSEMTLTPHILTICWAYLAITHYLFEKCRGGEGENWMKEDQRFQEERKARIVLIGRIQILNQIWKG